MQNLDVDRLASAFLLSLRDSHRDYEPGDELIELAENEPEVAWEVALRATALAQTEFELQCIGAFIIEELLQHYATAFVDRLVESIANDPKLARAAAAAHMTGLPRELWEPVNTALWSAGVSAEGLVDWDTIHPVTPDPSE